MNREEYYQLITTEAVKLMKMEKDKKYQLTIHTYEREGDVIACISNNATEYECLLFLYINLYKDTEEQLRGYYDKIMDYSDERHEAMNG